MRTLGRHLLVEFYGCNRKILNDPERIEKIVIDSAEFAGAKVIKTMVHHFSPFGVSGIAIIAESHVSIHTWPEYNFASIDIYTCGTVIDPWKSYEYLVAKLKPRNVTAVEMKRGILPLPEEKIKHKVTADEPSQKSLV